MSTIMNAGLTIQAVRTTPVIVPLPRPISTASGSVDCAPLILIDLETREGITGRAYLFSYIPFALKPLDTLVRELAPMIVGAAGASAGARCDAARGIHAARRHARTRGSRDRGPRHGRVGCAGHRGGLPARADAGRGAAAHSRLQQLRHDPPRRAPKKRSENTVSQGMTGLKIKIGWPTLAEDLAVVRAVRRAAGCVRADGGFQSVARCHFRRSSGAARSIRRAYWIEEPVRCDDFAGSAAVARAVETPIQIGENMAGTFELQTALAAPASDLLMLDVQQIGGVTGWMRGAALAHAAGRPVSSHAFVEFSSHLLAATPTCDWLEYFDKANAILAEPFPVRQGSVAAPDTPGAGLAWDMEAVKRYQV